MKLFMMLLILWAPALHAEAVAPMNPTDHAWQIIDAATASKNIDTRILITQAASLGGARPKVFAFLDQVVQDKESEVRMAACQSLASLKDPRSVAPLKILLKDKMPEIVFCAALALFHLDDPAGEEALLLILGGDQKTGSGFFSSKEQMALASLKTKRRFFATIFRLGIRFAPVPGLAMGVASMQSLTQDRGASGRSIAALALGKGDDAASLEALRDALKDKDPVVRASAVHSLAMRNDPSVREALVPLMEDKKEKVRYWAAVTYLRLDKVAEEAQASATHNGDDGDVVLPAKKPTRNR